MAPPLVADEIQAAISMGCNYLTPPGNRRLELAVMPSGTSLFGFCGGDGREEGHARAENTAYPLAGRGGGAAAGLASAVFATGDHRHFHPTAALDVRPLRP